MKHKSLSQMNNEKGRKMKKLTISVDENKISPKQWSTLLIELNLIIQQWKPFAPLKLESQGLTKIIAWGQRKGKELMGSEREWR